MTTGSRIASLRRRMSMTQPMLAEKMNVSRSTVTSWENDRRSVSNEDLVKLADYFGVTTDYLLGNVQVNPNEDTPKHIDVEDIVDDAAMLTSRNQALSDADRNAIRALLATYLNSKEGQDRLREFGGYDENGKKKGK